MKRILRRAILLIVVSGMGATAAYAFDDVQTAIKEIVEKMTGQPAKSEPKPPDVPTPEACPDVPALELFKYQIIFERTEEIGTLKGLNVIHTDVWERGGTTGFYVREHLPEFSTDVRMVYLFDKEAMTGGGTCPASRNWTECVENFAKIADAGSVGSIVRTCAATINIRALPAWKPSPDSPKKRQVAAELRREIEADWKGVQEIVVRDFDLRDPEITMYLRMPAEMPDGGEFKGCGFYPERQTVCDGWHMFGQAPLSGLRKWVFEKPYRLK